MQTLSLRVDKWEQHSVMTGGNWFSDSLAIRQNYGAPLVPYTRAYSIILETYPFFLLATTFLPLARLFILWRDFFSRRAFFSLARLFFGGATFFSMALLFFWWHHFFLLARLFFCWRDFFLAGATFFAGTPWYTTVRFIAGSDYEHV